MLKLCQIIVFWVKINYRDIIQDLEKGGEKKMKLSVQDIFLSQNFTCNCKTLNFFFSTTKIFYLFGIKAGKWPKLIGCLSPLMLYPEIITLLQTDILQKSF